MRKRPLSPGGSASSSSSSSSSFSSDESKRKRRRVSQPPWLIWRCLFNAPGSGTGQCTSEHNERAYELNGMDAKGYYYTDSDECHERCRQPRWLPGAPPAQLPARVLNLMGQFTAAKPAQMAAAGRAWSQVLTPITASIADLRRVLRQGETQADHKQWTADVDRQIREVVERTGPGTAIYVLLSEVARRLNATTVLGAASGPVLLDLLRLAKQMGGYTILLELSNEVDQMPALRTAALSGEPSASDALASLANDLWTGWFRQYEAIPRAEAAQLFDELLPQFLGSASDALPTMTRPSDPERVFDTLSTLPREFPNISDVVDTELFSSDGESDIWRRALASNNGRLVAVLAQQHLEHRLDLADSDAEDDQADAIEHWALDLLAALRQSWDEGDVTRPAVDALLDAVLTTGTKYQVVNAADLLEQALVRNEAPIVDYFIRRSGPAGLPAAVRGRLNNTGKLSSLVDGWHQTKSREGHRWDTLATLVQHGVIDPRNLPSSDTLQWALARDAPVPVLLAFLETHQVKNPDGLLIRLVETQNNRLVSGREPADTVLGEARRAIDALVQQGAQPEALVYHGQWVYRVRPELVRYLLVDKGGFERLQANDPGSAAAVRDLI